MDRPHGGVGRAGGAAALAALALLLFLPLLAVVWAAVAYGSPIDAAERLLSRPYYRERFAFTLLQATLSTALTLAAGLPVAYVLSREFRGAAAARAFLTVPFVLPPIVVAVGLRAVFPGMVDTLAGILVAHLFYNFAVVVRIVGSSWATLDPSLDDAAASLGARPWTRLLRVDLPLLAPAIASAALLVFLFTFTSLGIVLVLAGPSLYTVEAAIWQEIRAFDPERGVPRAGLLALAQLAFTFGVMLLYAWAHERASVRRRARPGPRRLPRRALPVAVGGALLAFVLVALPLGAVVLRSFAVGDGWGLDHYARLLGPSDVRTSSVAAAATHSVAFALGTVAVAVPLALGAVLFAASRPRGARWDATFLLPLGMSSATLGVGWLVATPACLGAICVDPPGAALVVAAHALIAFPFAARVLLTEIRALDPRVLDAASSLGAAPGVVLRRVTLPLLAPALRVAAVFAFAISIGEFGAALLLARPDTVTLPVAIHETLRAPGAALYGEALALSTLVVLLTTASFLLLERAGRGRDVL